MMLNRCQSKTILFLLVAIFSIASAFLLPTEAKAANQTVSPGVSSSDINTMISNMNDGDTLYFAAGIYNNLQIAVNKSITLQAVETNGAYADVTFTRTGAGINQGTAITIQSDGVKVKGLKINQYYEGIFSNNYDELTIADCIISRCDLNGIALFSNNNNIENCETSNNGGFWGMGNGIRVNGTGNTLTDCVANNNVQSGFYISKDNNTFIRCTAQENGTNGFEADGSHLTLTECSAIKNTTNGIILNNGISISTYATIEDCTLKQNTGHGMYVRGTNHEIKGCLIQNNNNGIFFDGTANTNTVQGCDIVNNTIGIYAYTSNNNTFSYCRIYGNTQHGLANNGTNNNANFNWWGAQTFAGQYNDIVGDLTLTNFFALKITAGAHATIGTGETVELPANGSLDYEARLALVGLDSSYNPDPTAAVPAFDLTKLPSGMSVTYTKVDGSTAIGDPRTMAMTGTIAPGSNATFTISAAMDSASTNLKIHRNTIAVSGVTLDTNAIDLSVGRSQTLVATVAPGDATNKNVSWSSSNTTVATVDQTGNVTAVDIGVAIITVTTAEGNKTATCEVMVIEPVKGITLDKITHTTVVGGVFKINATVSPDNAANKAIIWRSRNEAVATVDANGNVMAVSAGTAEIEAKTEDGEFTQLCTVTVKAALINSDNWPKDGKITDGKGFTIKPDVLGGTWGYDDTFFTKKDNADGSVTFTAKKIGITTITYTVDGQIQSKSITITEKGDSPQTGDNSLMWPWVIVLTLAAVGIGALVMLKKCSISAK